MLIIGVYTWAKTISRGEFFCPKCQVVQPYAYQSSRPFLTLYFIPVLPVSAGQESVVCQVCRQRFEPGVLQSEAALARVPGRVAAVEHPQLGFADQLLELIALEVIEDDHMAPAELKLSGEVYRRITQRELTDEQLMEACREALRKRTTIVKYLELVSSAWSFDEKLLAIQALFAIAGASGSISPKRMRSLLAIQTQLNIDNATFQAAIKDASQWF